MNGRDRIDRPTEDQLYELQRDGFNVRFHYVGNAHRDADAGEWHVCGDNVIIKIQGQASARINIHWGIASVEYHTGTRRQ